MTHYFDYASTTPVSEEVLAAYTDVLKEYYVNSESLYPEGVRVNDLMDRSRQQIAALLGVRKEEILFTSGASEANNMALKGTALAHRDWGKHIVTTAVEHSSVLNSCHWLEQYEGCAVTYLPVSRQGVISVEELSKALRPDTILVSVMAVNNETGAIMPIEAIKKIVKKHPHCYFHVDCTQALGKIPLDFTGIDMASFSAHKIYGLKGSGMLMKKKHVQIAPLISGGQQEQHLRGGTANSPADIVLGKTVRLALEQLGENRALVQQYHDYLKEELLKLPEVVINSPDDGSPYVLNFSCLKVTSEVMMNALAMKGYLVSAQSTCESGAAQSYVIAQMYQDPARLKGTIRVSFSPHQSWEEVKGLAQAVKEAVTQYGA